MTENAGDQQILISIDDYSFVDRFRANAAGLDGVHVEFSDRYSPIYKSFAPMVRHQEFDACEMAASTYIQAVAKGHPISLLPVTLAGKFHHSQIYRIPGIFPGTPADLTGCRIGVRSYSQTTGVWVRSILRDQFKLDLASVEWVVTEPPHVPGLELPANVVEAPAGATLTQMLESGEVQAAIGNMSKTPGAEPLVSDAGVLAQDWHARYGFVPVNHILTASSAFLREHLDAAKRLYDCMVDAIDKEPQEAKAKQSRESGWTWAAGLEYLPFGWSKLRPILDFLVEENYRQGLIPERMPVDGLVNDAIRMW